MKKTIYTFTLDDEYPSDNDIHNLRFLAEYIYEDIECGAYDRDKSVLVKNSILKRNILFSKKQANNNYSYRFSSEDDIRNKLFYEPIIFTDNSFGITIDDSTIDINMMQNILNNALKIIGFNYKINIDTISYNAKDTNDESSRRIAIIKATSELFNKLLILKETINNYRKNKKEFKSRKLINSNMPTRKRC